MWTKIRSTWPVNDLHWLYWPLLAHFRRKIMPLDQNPHQTTTRFDYVGFSMYVCGFSVLQMRQFCLCTYPQRSKWTSSEKMIGFFCKTIAGPLNALDGQLASTPEPIGYLYSVILRSLCKIRLNDSTKFSIVENDGELMLMTLHLHFLHRRNGCTNCFWLFML